MRKIANIAFFGVLVVAIVLLLALVDCSGERPSLEQTGYQLSLHGAYL